MPGFRLRQPGGGQAEILNERVRADLIICVPVHTEIYYILECDADAALELDGRRVAVAPGHAVLIPPLTRHRAAGRMRLLNVVVPPFDPADEWFD